MKWFKHDIDASQDTRIILLEKKFKLEGYAIYFKLLEIVGKNIKEDNHEQWSFVEEIHTIETLSEVVGVTPDKLRTVLEYCNEIGLIYKIDGKLCIPKILSRLDEYARKRRGDFDVDQRKKELIGQCQDKLRTMSGQNPGLEQNRTEQKRTEGVTKKITSNTETLIFYFNEKFKSKYQLTPGRRDKCKTRLQTFSVDQIKQAIDNLSSKPFYRGENDSGWKADPDYLFRSDEIIDKALNLKTKPKGIVDTWNPEYDNMAVDPNGLKRIAELKQKAGLA